ncbi:hypothetical protein EJ419_03055 [Alloscardovia theropitheci]|uniref:Uncharacterized protein n=1 Tax=Alloscardovia theropitheci TaxID=2496842 RepID=A0A4R0QSN1_9BIFI|nr:hypothetical protein [Alloscardovia theropitheci]TCD54468.1 hypothetical protein EJ419_03055 [Alloscardovia theropitheci]
MWQVIRIILIVLAIIVALVVISFFAVRNHLDRRAEQLQKGNEMDRQMASDLREISRQIDRGNMYR